MLWQVVVKLKIIGSAAGGGFPQWNCNYRLSREVRSPKTGLTPRSQSSIAASADGSNWALFNASPDIREQISNTPELQPDANGPLRNSPIKAVVLTNADVDHIAGLLTLREKQAFNLYASSRILETLANNPIFRVLDETLVKRIELPLGGTTQLEGPDGPLGIEIETYAVPGKIALFLEDNSDPVNFGSDDGDTIGVRIYAPVPVPVKPFITFPAAPALLKNCAVAYPVPDASVTVRFSPIRKCRMQVWAPRPVLVWVILSCPGMKGHWRRSRTPRLPGASLSISITPILYWIRPRGNVQS